MVNICVVGVEIVVFVFFLNCVFGIINFWYYLIGYSLGVYVVGYVGLWFLGLGCIIGN